MGVGALRGPGFWDWSQTVSRKFQVAEGQQVEFRAEAFNVFNRQNWDTPANANLTLNTNATTIAAGVGRISNLAQGTTPRQIQFGARLVF